RDHGCRTPRDHSSRHGLLLRGDRSARPAGFAWKTGWGRWRARSARRPDHMQLRSAQIRRALGNADLYGAATLPESNRVARAMRKPNGQLEVTAAEAPGFMQDLPVREIWGIGEKTERRLEELGVKTCRELQRFSRPDLVDLFGKFGSELFDLCRGIDDRPVEPDRPRKSLSTEETFVSDLETLEECEERLGELFQELMAELAQKETNRRITKIFVKLKFADFTRTAAERAGLEPTLAAFRNLLAEAFARTGKKVRLIGVGVRLAETPASELQIALLSIVGQA